MVMSWFKSLFRSVSEIQYNFSTLCFMSQKRQTQEININSEDNFGGEKEGKKESKTNMTVIWFTLMLSKNVLSAILSRVIVVNDNISWLLMRKFHLRELFREECECNLPFCQRHPINLKIIINSKPGNFC